MQAEVKGSTMTKNNVTDHRAHWAAIEAFREQHGKDEAEKRHRDSVARYMSKVAPRFSGKTFVDFRLDYEGQVRVKTITSCYVSTFKDRLEEAACLIFLGKPGTGKTLLALIMYQALAETGWQVEYQPSLNFLRALQERQYESYAAFDRCLDHYRKLPLLIIDEVTEGCGKGAYPADWERHLLRQLIDERYQAKRCTLIISNRNNQELIERIGEPSVDRLLECGSMLAFSWQSYRKK